MKTIVFFKALCVCFVLSAETLNQKQNASEVFNYHTASPGLGSFATNLNEAQDKLQNIGQGNNGQYNEDSALIIQYEDVGGSSGNNQGMKYVAVVEDVDEGLGDHNQVQMFVQSPGIVQGFGQNVQQGNKVMSNVDQNMQQGQNFNVQQPQKTITDYMVPIQGVSGGFKVQNGMNLDNSVNMQNMMNVQKSMIAQKPVSVQKPANLQKQQHIHFMNSLSFGQQDKKQMNLGESGMQNMFFGKANILRKPQEFVMSVNSVKPNIVKKPQEFLTLDNSDSKLMQSMNFGRGNSIQKPREFTMFESSGSNLMQSASNGRFQERPKMQFVNSAKVQNIKQVQRPGVNQQQNRHGLNGMNVRQLRQQMLTASHGLNRQKIKFPETPQQPQEDQVEIIENGQQFDETEMLKHLGQVHFSNEHRHHFQKPIVFQDQGINNEHFFETKEHFQHNQPQHVPSYSDEYQIENVKTKIVEKKIPFPYTIEKHVPFYTEKKVPYEVKVPYPKPYTVEKKFPYHVQELVKVPYYVPQPYEVIKKVPYEVQVVVPRPYEVEVPIPKPYTVEKQVPYPVKVFVPTPYTVEKKVPFPVKYEVPVPQPYTVERKVPYEVRIPVERPYTVNVPKPYTVNVNRYVPYPVTKRVPFEVKVPVDRPYPVEVPKKVPYKVTVPVPRPYTVEKKVPVNVEKYVPYTVEVPVEKPFPVYREVPFPVEKEVPYPLHVPLQNEPAISYSDWKPKV